MKKVAVIVDWENVRKSLFEKATQLNSSWRVDYNDISNFFHLINAFIKENEEIYRIFIYLSAPYEPTEQYKKKYGEKAFEQSINVAKKHKEFIKKFGTSELVAIRKGKIQLKDVNGQPFFTQKQVDMLMGLDIAHLSYLKLVDRILILCGDTDLIPALKIARMNGIQIILAFCPDVQRLNFDDLKYHSDFIRCKDFKEIFKLQSDRNGL